MPLNPAFQTFLQQCEQLQLPPLVSLTPTEARSRNARLWRKALRPRPVFNIVDRAIPGPAAAIPVRIYTPEVNKILPLLVYFHGGGWVLGNLDSMDSFCRTLAGDGECIVVSVDYRLAPEHKFPAAVEDAYAATTWVASNASTLNGDPTRLAVGGDSAGGNLAAVVTLLARDRGQPFLVWQLLLYPSLQYGAETESYQQYGDGQFGLSQEEMTWFWQHYLNHPTEGRNPLVSPLLAPDLSGLPPAHIITAEYDILRDEAEAYAMRLKQAGIPVHLQRYDGAIHTFIELSSKVDVSRRAIADITSRLRQTFDLCHSPTKIN